MPDIYTPEWYEALRQLINNDDLIRSKAPKGQWTAVVELVGDGLSPYVREGTTKRFLVHIEDGQCTWYRQLADDEEPEPGSLDYRFTGPASVFDEIAAGITDPVDAGLEGRIKIRGDMRFLMRQAELVKEILDIYQRGLQTEWPLGKPPYRS
jgi:hypothetical protein